MSIYLKFFKSGLVATAALSMAACGSSGSYRLSSVGTVPDNSSSASTAASANDPATTGGGTSGSTSGGASTGGQATLGGSRVLVTAGNAVMGAGQTVGGTTLQPVTGTVAGVLNKTGQTLVNLGNGDSLILNRAGGRIGDLVKVDLGSNTVIGAPKGSSLLGAGVLTSATNAATATVGRTGIVTVNANNSPTATTATGTVTPPAGTPGTGLVGGVTSTVKGLLPKK